MQCTYATRLEWKLIYVSSPGNEELDQELDSCLVGPVPVGTNSFDFESPAPDPRRIPPEDLLGVAALILTGSYNDQEFVRVGYYQNTGYDDEVLRENPPAQVVVERLTRDVNAKPRVTRFQIKWCVCLLSFCLRDCSMVSVLGTCYRCRLRRLRLARHSLQLYHLRTISVVMNQWMYSQRVYQSHNYLFFVFFYHLLLTSSKLSFLSLFHKAHNLTRLCYVYASVTH